MRKSGIGLLLAGLAALGAGCGADVDKPGQSFVGEVDLKATASGPGTITPGTNGEWTFTVNNAGPEPARDVPVDVGLDPAGGVLADSIRWTCSATAGSCGAESGQGAPATTLSLDNGGSAVITVRTPVAYTAGSGAEVGATVTVGEDGTYPDPTPGDNTATATVTLGEPQELADFRDEVIYWALTDRFANGDATNDDADGTRRGDEADPSNHIGWHGGDFAGIQQKIEEGYFQAMGFTAIWISPVIYQVPALDNGNAAYHGYWPEATLQIEPHFGTIEELKELVDTAHANGLKIIIDFVANHVGYDAEIIQTNRDWVRLGTECGTEDQEICLAGLPDLRQENPEVAQFLLDSLQNLVSSTGVDAFRWDANKYVNTDWWLDAFAPGAPADRSAVWSVGESFDVLDYEKIAFYLDEVGTPGMLHFPYYQGVGGMILGFTDRVAETLEMSDPFWSDPTRMVTFLDNHDVERVATRVSRDRGLDRAGTIRMLDGLYSLLYGSRGIPAIYYGSEIAMEGIDDFNFPDNSNRKDMDFAAAGDPNVTSCYVEDQGLDNTEAFGTAMFLRGAFNDWADPPLAEAQVFNQGGGLYAQAVQLAAGSYGFKVAAADWSVERTNDAETVVPGTAVTLNTGGGNTVVEVAEDGCYRFDVDTSGSVENPPLTVSRLNVAAPLVARFGELAAAREAYPALRRGEQEVVFDSRVSCSVPPSWPASELPGPLFVRGGFNDWGNPEPPPESGFIRTDLDRFEAEFEIAAGSYEYKIATADWSYERTVDGAETALDTELALIPGSGQPNSQFVVAEDGCYNFAIDASDLDNLVMEVTADTDGTCRAVSGDPDAQAFGKPVYVRNSYNAFQDPPPLTDRFAQTAPGILTARTNNLQFDNEYKIASADWSVDRAVAGTTFLDSRQLLVVPEENGTVDLTGQFGCFEWTIDATDPDEAYLTVAQADGVAGDVLVLKRTLSGAAPVFVVYNHSSVTSDEAVDLAGFGGISVDGLADGPVVEITGRETDLVVSGGRLFGTVPPYTTYLISDR